MTSPLLADRVQETTTTTGTGTLTLGGATTGCRTFNSAFSNGNVVYYVIDDGAGNWEVGSGTVGTGTLTRDTVYASSNAGSKVSFAAGSKTVYCDASANVFPSGNIVGTSDAQTLTNKTLTAAGSNTVEATSGPTSSQLAGNRNKIINGAMIIDQRNAGASVAWSGGDGFYTLDRLRLQRAGTATLSVQQVADAPPGFSKSAKFTVTSAAAPGAGDYYTFGQIIEPANYVDFGYGTSSAKTVTVSFWVKSSVTGSYTVSIYDWLVGDYTYTALITINSANTWEQKIVTIPGVTTGSWAYGLYFRFDLGSGSGFTTSSPNTWNTTASFRATGAVNFTANASATLNFTGLQIEPGSVNTPFENRLYGTELALCQRYYYRGIIWSSGSGDLTNLYTACITLPVTMRTQPSVTNGADSNGIVCAGTLYNVTAATAAIYNSWFSGASMAVSVTTNAQIPRWNVAAGRLPDFQANAEL